MLFLNVFLSFIGYFYNWLVPKIFLNITDFIEENMVEFSFYVRRDAFIGYSQG